MNRISSVTATTALAMTMGLSTGCRSDAPRYEDKRPGNDTLVDGNTGIEAKDVLGATDMFAKDLLGQPALNASQRQWVIVLAGVMNNTNDKTMTYGVFSNRLKSRLAQLGQGRVALIENKSTFHNLQDKELEGPPGTGAAGIQPDYALYITIDELPNRATDFYSISGTLSNLSNRSIVWTSQPYEFQSAR